MAVRMSFANPLSKDSQMNRHLYAKPYESAPQNEVGKKYHEIRIVVVSTGVKKYMESPATQSNMSSTIS